MRRLLLAAAALLLVGCQQAPAPAAIPVGSLTKQLKAEGDTLAARGDYAAALVKYQEAARQEPGDVTVWFAVGTALSHLKRHDEAVEAFRRVVDLGRPDSPEVDIARRWLISAGELSHVTFAASAQDASGGAQVDGPKGTLRGKVQLQGEDPKVRPRIKLVLSGGDSASRGKSLARSVVVGEPYSFDDVPAGEYRLTAYSGQTQLAEERVAVEADRQTVMDLRVAVSAFREDPRPVRPGGKAGVEKHDPAQMDPKAAGE